jgi:hypothetical protein
MVRSFIVIIGGNSKNMEKRQASISGLSLMGFFFLLCVAKLLATLVAPL